MPNRFSLSRSPFARAIASTRRDGTGPEVVGHKMARGEAPNLRAADTDLEQAAASAVAPQNTVVR